MIIMNTTKGEKIETLATIIATGTKEHFPNPKECSIIVFRLDDGREVIWHSDSAAKCRQQAEVGWQVALSGYLYGKNLRRVQVSKGCLIWGMGE